MEKPIKNRTREEIIEGLKRSILRKQRAIAESQIRINEEVLKKLAI